MEDSELVEYFGIKGKAIVKIENTKNIMKKY